MNHKVIVLEKISKNYQKVGFQALSDINFTVNNGDCIGFIGKNGAGKTVLLKIISGIIYPSSGSLIVRKPISPIFEYGAGFHPELRGRENIFLYGSLLGIRKKLINNKLDEIIAFSGLDNFLDFKLKHYSTGMKIRLAFSTASILKSEILILDEALSAGDKSFVQKVHERVFELQNQGITMLITSHSQEILKKFCKKGFVLDKGHLLFGGNINDAIDFYKNNVLST